MPNDATYQPGVVQIRQNGDLAVVTGTSAIIETGGGLTVESGGALAVASGGTVSLTGAMTIPTGGYIAVPVENATTTAALTNYGLSIISTTAADLAFSLAAPTAAGMIKTIASVDHGATTITQTVKLVGCKVSGGSTVLAGTSVIGFLNNTSITLISLGTTSWAIYGPRPTTEISFA
jgi:hypothetical protein